MKKLKLIPIAFAILALAFTSCKVNDDYPVEASSKPLVNVQFNDHVVSVDASGAITIYDLPVTLTEAIEGNMLVEYSINGEDFNMSIPSGSTSFTIPIDRTEVAEYTVHLMNTTGVNQLQNRVINTEYDTVLVRVVEPQFVNFYFDWDDSYYDFDIYLVAGDQDLSGDVIAYSVIDNYSTGISEEGFVLSYAIPDGVYSIFVQDYWGDAGGQDYTMDVTFPDTSVTSFSGTFVSNFWFLSVEKTTDLTTGEVTLTVTEL